MLRSLDKILGSSIAATDGEIGRVHDFLFEDVSWRVAYLVAETGGWFRKRHVLLSPSALQQPDWNRKVLPVSLTMEQVKNSPDIDMDQPVSRQQEMTIDRYYGWTSYWDTPSQPREDLMTGDPHLRSCREVMDYRVTSAGDELGKVGDFILDDRNWAIQFLMTRTGVEAGDHVLMLPIETAVEISWKYRRIELDTPAAAL